MIYKPTVVILVAMLASPAAWSATETRELDSFEAISFELPFNVEFVVSDEPFVTLEGDEDTMDEIITDVRKNTLKIRKENSWFDWSDEEVHVTVGYQQLSKITMAGSGDGFAEDMEADELALRIAGSADLEIDNLIANDLKISISGSGNVTLNALDADSISTSIQGAGDVELTGRVVSQKISISGSGDHNARDLHTQETDIKVQGSGDVEVWADASLNATIMGSGDIQYYGSPSLSERIMGSGNIQHRGDEP